MRPPAYRLRQIGLCMLAMLLLSACSLPARQPSVALPNANALEPASGQEQRWWRACFRLPFDDEQQPRWSLDALLAEQVAAPSLRRHAAQIRLWRFHRRAAQDATGHQFSLLFYSDAGTADALFAELQGHPLTAELLAAQQLSQLLTPCGPPDQDQGAIAASSDPNWDPRLQRTWPYFSMGVSAHWLALIEEVGRTIPLEASDSAALLRRYQRIQQEIDEIWREDGQHAYLHHLNALFGYQPLLMRY